MNTKNGRSRPKPIDLVLVALLLTGGVLLLLLYTAKDKGTPVYLRYTVTATLPDQAVAALAVGDHLVDGVGKEAAGEILDICATPAMTETYRGAVTKTGYTRLTLTLGTDAEARGEEYFIGSTRIVPGAVLYLHGRAAVEALCLTAEAAVPWA